MKIKNVMSPRASVIHFDKTVVEAAMMMEAQDVGSIPVEKNDKMIGMITDRDICIRVVAQRRDPNITTVEEVMSEGIEYCFEEDEINSVATKMARNQVRRLPVVNANKRLVGMVSLGDIATKVKDPSISHQVLSGVSHH
ncbi:CBS domain-containing protein [Bdellovibrio reynosensis]|uniref:CBS domain-containing protein n=1 Tax=Bdellovibrio reynosensis TaxID=2835041 RepID=A0ABY4CDK1_9BACT|nr:CBS domain-containing protein [Bdellovibrio reynosensis]UOF02913.1 CBS domain-containing protein [Bdellovibrio reynosensis]